MGAPRLGRCHSGGLIPNGTTEQLTLGFVRAVRGGARVVRRELVVSLQRVLRKRMNIAWPYGPVTDTDNL